MTSSPKFKNLTNHPKQSPKEIKEKMRKDYKNKIHNCRGMLMDKLRGSFLKLDLQSTLTDIYQSTFNFTEASNDDEFEHMVEFQNELVQEELEWWIKEYEKCQMVNVDWSAIEDNSDVICPVCQKTNFQLNSGYLNCSQCNISIQSEKSLSELKAYILSLIDSHNAVCNSDVQFSVVVETNDTHIYLICEHCMEMKMVI